MIPSPLHLETYFFTEIQVEACPEGCDSPGEGELASSVEVSRHEDDSGKWMVQLGIRQSEDEAKGCPEYTFKIQVVGLFKVDKEFPLEQAEHLVRANGPAVLYGAVREMVANLTSRGPFSTVELPTVTFIDEANPAAPKPISAAPRSPHASKKRASKTEAASRK